MKKVKVAIIGAGSAGLSARREVSQRTEDYLVFDGGMLGTTCARVGCMPSKVLIQSANDFYRRKSFEQVGIKGANSLSVDIPLVLNHVRKLRDRFVRGVSSSMDSWISSKLIRHHVTFTSANSLKAGEDEYEFEKAIICTGGSPSIPEQLKDFKDYLYTSDTIFEQVDLPKRIAVLGLGVIGLELGQALSQLGLDVLAIARRKSIGGIIDPEINDYACDYFAKAMNVNFSGLEKVIKKNDTLELKLGDGTLHQYDKILVTSGRRLNLESLNLHRFCSIVDENKIPQLDPYTFSLKEHPHLFIAGDLTGKKQLLHEASDEGRIAAINAVSEVRKPFKVRTPLAITFSDPNIASCGKTIDQLKDEKYKVGKVSFEGQGRSIIKLKEVGLLKVYGEEKTGRLLGAEMFGPDCEHIAHLLSWCIEQKLNVLDVLAMPFYHPVVEEGLRTALRSLRDELAIKSNSPLEIKLHDDAN